MLPLSPPPRLSSLARQRWVPHAAALGVLTLLGGVLFFHRLAERGLWSSHEGRAGQHAQLMLNTGRWGMPRLYWGESDYQKPPLYYWMVAGLAELRGGIVDAWAIRLPAACAALAGVWVVYALGAVMWRPATGFVAALILATNLRYSWLARVGRIDMPLALAVLIVLGAFWMAYRSIEGAVHSKRTALWMLVAYLAAALAVMLKGPVGLVLPLLAAWLFLFLERQAVWPWQTGFWRLARRLGLGWGILLVLAIAGPWFVWATVVTDGEFFRMFVGRHNLDRALAVEGLRPGPFWYYIPQLFIDMFPWGILIPGAVIASLRAGALRRAPWLGNPAAAGDAAHASGATRAVDRSGPAGAAEAAARRVATSATRFALAWTAAMFLLLSAVRFKRHDYLLPLIPGCALLLGGFWNGLLEARTARAAWRWFRLLGGMMVALTAAALVLVAVLRDEAVTARLLETRLVGRWIHATDRMVFAQLRQAIEAAQAWLLPAAAALAVLWSTLAVRRRRPLAAATLLGAAWTVAFVAYVACVLPPLEPLRDQQSLARLARDLVPEGERPFYYGREDQQLMFCLGPSARWLRDRKGLRQVITRNKPAFVVVELERFRQRAAEWPDVVMVPLAWNTDNPFGTHRDPAVLITNAAGLRRAEALHTRWASPLAN